MHPASTHGQLRPAGLLVKHDRRRHLGLERAAGRLLAELRRHRGVGRRVELGAGLRGRDDHKGPEPEAAR
jgi:hypothetical protein